MKYKFKKSSYNNIIRDKNYPTNCYTPNIGFVKYIRKRKPGFDRLPIERAISERSSEQKDLFSLIIENLPDQIYLKDADSRFIRCNSTVALIAGYKSQDDMIGKTDFDFHPPEDAQRYFDGEQSVIKLGHSLINYEEHFIDKKTKELKWNLSTKVPVKDDTNKVVGLLGINRDITDMKNALIEREKLMADLIQRNKDLEQFTYIVSHNLRTPVANIMGLVALANDFNIDESDKKEIWDGITVSIKNLNTVINDLNHILQVRKEVDENKETIYFHRLVDDIKTSIANLIIKEQVKIECDFDGAPHIYSTSGYLFSIFYNLISNSIKYRMPEADPVISIKSAAHKNTIELSFKDNGKGIDLEKNGKQLFGLYKRFDTEIEGKGAGLFMVKTQVELLGGTVSVKSQPGKGTEFIIKLPKKTTEQ